MTLFWSCFSFHRELLLFSRNIFETITIVNFVHFILLGPWCTSLYK